MKIDRSDMSKTIKTITTTKEYDEDGNITKETRQEITNPVDDFVSFIPGNFFYDRTGASFANIQRIASTVGN